MTIFAFSEIRKKKLMPARYKIFASCVLAFIFLSASCSKDNFTGRGQTNWRSDPIVEADRLPSEESRKVLILYMAAHNNLSDYIRNNLDTLEHYYLPPKNRNADVVLVCSKFAGTNERYGEKNAPVIFQLSKNAAGQPVRDTLFIFPEGTPAVSSVTFRTALEFAHEHFPAASYGLLFSSHATGWLPVGYYNNTPTEGLSLSAPLQYRPEKPDDFPLLKSFGQENIRKNGRLTSYEMDLRKFAEAIPMHLDYIIADACLCGGVEIASELQGKTDYLLASQTEILADGIQYNTLLEHLFLKKEPDLKGICRDYCNFYAQKPSEMERSATISLIRCDKLERLQTICAELFEKYRGPIAALDAYAIQGFFTLNKHWFYDLKDILVHAGITAEETARLDVAISECVEYEAHTEQFLQRFPIRVNCGLSMYLPCQGNPVLNDYYRSLIWNRQTSLVR